MSGRRCVGVDGSRGPAVARNGSTQQHGRHHLVGTNLGQEKRGEKERKGEKETNKQKKSLAAPCWGLLSVRLVVPIPGLCSVSHAPHSWCGGTQTTLWNAAQLINNQKSIWPISICHLIQWSSTGGALGPTTFFLSFFFLHFFIF